MGEHQPLWAFDVGNTRVHFAEFLQGSLVHRADFENPRSLPPEILARKCGDVWIASVRPTASEQLVAALGDAGLGSSIRRLEDPRDIPISHRLLHPESVGLDRLLNGLAVTSAERDVAHIVIDAGTAMTVDAISSSGVFLGGAIAPGLSILGSSLARNTAKLPRVVTVGLPEPIGRYTEAAISSGIYYGFCGAARELVSVIGHELKEEHRIWVTGGDREILSKRLERIDYIDGDLTLKGILEASRSRPLPSSNRS